MCTRIIKVRFIISVLFSFSIKNVKTQIERAFIKAFNLHALLIGHFHFYQPESRSVKWFD